MTKLLKWGSQRCSTETMITRDKVGKVLFERCFIDDIRNDDTWGTRIILECRASPDHYKFMYRVRSDGIVLQIYCIECNKPK